MTETSDTGMPASLEIAWGLRERPGKGPRPGLSLERIVAAGVKVADSDGLGAVSMSRVAADLGVSTMSLYRYVSAKDELLVLMVDAAYGSPPPESDLAEGWRPGLARWAWADLTAVRRHLWVVRIPISGPPITPNQLTWLERGLFTLRDTGLRENEKLSVMLLLAGYVRNTAIQIADMHDAAATSGSTAEEAMAKYGGMLARVIDPARFPALTRAITSGAFEDGPEDEFGDEEFRFGLERVLDGVEALVRERG